MVRPFAASCRWRTRLSPGTQTWALARVRVRAMVRGIQIGRCVSDRPGVRVRVRGRYRFLRNISSGNRTQERQE